MEEFLKTIYDEEGAALEQYPNAGMLFLSLSIPAVGKTLYIDPNAPTDNWEGIIKGDVDD